MEPWIYNATKNWGVHTWGKWSRPDEKKFLYVGRHKNHLNAVQWEIRTPDIIPENFMLVSNGDNRYDDY